MSRKPTAGQLAVIAAQFMAAGDDRDVALARASKLYFGAVKYLKAFNAMTPLQQAVETDEQETVLKLLAEGGVPALDYFRSTATTKTERHIRYNAFTNLIQREFGRLPETIAPEMLLKLHARLRARRSHARSKRRKKSVK